MKTEEEIRTKAEELRTAYFQRFSMVDCSRYTAWLSCFEWILELKEGEPL